ncbi:MAG TPA: hypothetical protein DDW67_01230 [Elusimicrobia bacterium]|nr:hypothetical protein [Elusimicrobiota bacterium]
MKKMLKIGALIVGGAVLLFVAYMFLLKYYGGKCNKGSGEAAISSCNKLMALMSPVGYFDFMRPLTLHRKANLCGEAGLKEEAVKTLEEMLRFAEKDKLGLKTQEMKQGLLLDTYERLVIGYADLGRSEDASGYAEKAVQIGPKNPAAYLSLAGLLAREYAEKSGDPRKCENLSRFTAVARGLISRDDKLKSSPATGILLNYFSACGNFCKGDILNGYYYLNLLKAGLSDARTGSEETKAMIITAESMMSGKTEEAQGFVVRQKDVSVPAEALSSYRLGMSRFRGKRYASAIGYFDKSLALAPHFTEAISNKCMSLQYLKKYAEAEKCFDDGLAKGPDSAVLWNNKGTLMFSLNRPAESETCFNNAVASDKNFADAWGNAGALKLHQKDYDKALPLFDEAVRLAPANKGYILGRCKALDGAGLTAEAARCYKAAKR